MPGVGTGSLPFNYQDFSGGLNTRDQAFLLADTEARDLSNVQGSLTGAIVKRAGLATLATPAVTLTSLAALESVSPSVLIGAGSTFLYSISSGGTVTQIKSALTSNLRWEFLSAPVVSAQGPLFGMNGTDTPQQWDGAAGSTSAWTATDASGTVPNGKYCLYFNNQVFVAGVASQPSRLYWSGIADPTAWNPANLNGSGFMDFDPKDGAAITAIGTVGPYVLVAKPRKLWILVDPASATVRRISGTVGCVAHRSVASSSNGTYFLSEDRGVYLTNGSTVVPISDKIMPTIQSVQPGLASQASGLCFNAHYYLSLPISSANNDTTLDYDEALSQGSKSPSWWKHSFGSNQFAVWHPAGVAGLYSAKATSAIVDHAFAPGVLVDNGTPFTWAWRGPWQSPSFYRRRRFPTEYYRKRLRQVRFAGTGTVDVSMAKNFAVTETLVRANVGIVSTTGTWEDSLLYGVDGTYGGTPTIWNARLFSLGVANAFSLVFSATSTTADSLFLYVLMLTDRRDGISS